MQINKIIKVSSSQPFQHLLTLKEVLRRARQYQQPGGRIIGGLANQLAGLSNFTQDIILPTGRPSKTFSTDMLDGVVRKTDTNTDLIKNDYLFNVPGLILPNNEEIAPFTMFMPRIYHKHRFNPSKKPIVLWHGAFENGNSWQVGIEGRNVRHLNKYDSFANYLASKGYDVYIVNLPFAKRLYTRYVQYVYGIEYNPDPKIGFDEILEYIPSIIKFVLETHNRHVAELNNDKGDNTQKDKVFWIGHSLGAMLMYAGMARFNQQIAAGAAIGGPISLDGIMIKWAANFNRFVEQLGKEEKRLQNSRALHDQENIDLTSAERNGPLKRLARMIVPLTDGLYFTPSWLIDLFSPYLPLIDYIYNSRNVNLYTVKPFLLSAAEPIYDRLMDFFMHMARRSEFVSITPGLNIDYIEKMGEIEAPIIFIGGELDCLATPTSIKNAWRFAVLKEDAKQRQTFFPLVIMKNTGHVDLITGFNALNGVANTILDFFEQHK
jgi:pimeloyl-ACP methyl ester carboxylesterase